MVGTLAVLVALAVTPATGAPVSISPITINNTPGQQVDPHVDGNIAAYTDFASSAVIRYYDFSTNVDSAIPTGGNNDQLSDVSAGRIVFTRILGDGSQAVMLFDANTATGPTEVNPTASSQRGAVAIGANTIAYVDYDQPGGALGEIVVWDLVDSVATRITNDGNIDQAPAVSPDGSVVVWERCPASSLSNCDVVMAVKSGGGWTTSDVAATPAPEGFPDSNGTNVVWTAHNGTDYDIYWRAVAGGATQQLELPGDQVHPSIAGDVIAFEGTSTGGTDLFIYHLADGLLYQLTATPGVNESLNDVTVLTDESIRVVWQANDGSDGMNDIHGATFALTATNTTPGADGGTGGGGGGGGDGGHCVPGRGRGHWRHGNGHGYGHDKHGHCHGGHHGNGHHGRGGHDDDDDDDDDHDGDCGGRGGDNDDDDDDDDDDGDRGGRRGGGNHGNGGHRGGGHHKRGGTGSIHQALTPDEPAPAMGCASTGSTALPLSLLAMAAFLALRPKRAEVRGRQR